MSLFLAAIGTSRIWLAAVPPAQLKDIGAPGSWRPSSRPRFRRTFKLPRGRPPRGAGHRDEGPRHRSAILRVSAAGRGRRAGGGEGLLVPGRPAPRGEAGSGALRLPGRRRFADSRLDAFLVDGGLDHSGPGSTPSRLFRESSCSRATGSRRRPTATTTSRRTCEARSRSSSRARRAAIARTTFRTRRARCTATRSARPSSSRGAAPARS